MRRTLINSELSEEELRLLYLDWCSAQVARRFLELSHDEVWLRSNLAAALPAAPTEARGGESGSQAPLDRIPGYLDVVRKTTLVLAREMNLPQFADWKKEYLEDPDAFDVELMRRK
ncbi:MAG: hypothetical protein WD737_14080 [Gemmatimonadota bacterium]